MPPESLGPVLGFVMCRAGAHDIGPATGILQATAESSEAAEKELIQTVCGAVTTLVERDAAATLKKDVRADMAKWQKQVGSVDEWAKLSELAKTMDAKSAVLPNIFTPPTAEEWRVLWLAVEKGEGANAKGKKKN